MSTIDKDIALFDASWTDSCAMLNDGKGGCQRAPRDWGVGPEIERAGRMGREFYHYDTGATVFVPMLPNA